MYLSVNGMLFAHGERRVDLGIVLIILSILYQIGIDFQSLFKLQRLDIEYIISGD